MATSPNPKYFMTQVETVASYQRHDARSKEVGHTRASVEAIGWFNGTLDDFTHTSLNSTPNNINVLYRMMHEKGVMDIKLSPLNPDGTFHDPTICWYADYDVRIVYANVLQHLSNSFVAAREKGMPSMWQCTPGGTPGLQDQTIRLIPGVGMKCDIVMLQAGHECNWKMLCLVSVQIVELRRVRRLIVNTLNVFASTKLGGDEHARVISYHETKKSTTDDTVLILEVQPNAPPGNTMNDKGLAVMSSYSIEMLRKHEACGTVDAPLPLYGRTPSPSEYSAMWPMAKARQDHVPKREELLSSTFENALDGALEEHALNYPDPRTYSGQGASREAMLADLDLQDSRGESKDHTPRREQLVAEDVLAAVRNDPSLRRDVARQLRDLSLKEKKSDKAFGNALAAGMADAIKVKQTMQLPEAQTMIAAAKRKCDEERTNERFIDRGVDANAHSSARTRPPLDRDVITRIERSVYNNKAWQQALLKAKRPGHVRFVANALNEDVSVVWDFAKYIQGVVSGNEPFPWLVDSDGARVAPQEIKKVANENGLGVEVVEGQAYAAPGGSKPASTGYRNRAIQSLFVEFDLKGYKYGAAVDSPYFFRSLVRDVIFHSALKLRAIHCNYGRGTHECAPIDPSIEPRSVYADAAFVTTPTALRQSAVLIHNIDPVMYMNSILNPMRNLYPEAFPAMNDVRSEGKAAINIMELSPGSLALLSESTDQRLLHMCCSVITRELPEDKRELLALISSMDGGLSMDVWARTTRAIELLHWQHDEEHASPVPAKWLRMMVVDIMHTYVLRFNREAAAGLNCMLMPFTVHRPSKLIFHDDWYGSLQLQWGVQSVLNEIRERVNQSLAEYKPNGTGPIDVDNLRIAMTNGDPNQFMEELACTLEAGSWRRVTVSSVQMLGADCVRDIEPPFVSVHRAVQALARAMGTPDQKLHQISHLMFTIVGRFFCSEEDLLSLFFNDWMAVVHFLAPSVGTKTVPKKGFVSYRLQWWVWVCAGLLNNSLHNVGYWEPEKHHSESWGGSWERREECTFFTDTAPMEENRAAIVLVKLAINCDAMDAFAFLVKKYPGVVSSAITATRIPSHVFAATMNFELLYHGEDELLADTEPSNDLQNEREERQRDNLMHGPLFGLLSDRNKWRDYLMHVYARCMKERMPDEPEYTPPSNVPGVSRAEIDDLLSMSQDDVRRLVGPALSAHLPSSKAEGKKKVAPKAKPLAAPKPSLVAMELEETTNELRTRRVPALKTWLASILEAAVDCGTKHSDIKTGVTEFEEALYRAHGTFEHKVRGEAWVGFIELETHARVTLKKVLADKKKREKEDEAARKLKAVQEKKDAEYKEFLAHIRDTIIKARTAWDKWEASRFLDEEALKEATSRPKTAKKRLQEITLRPGDEGVWDDVASLVQVQKETLERRKRQERDHARLEEANTVPPVPERVVVPEEPMAGSSSGSSPVEPPMSTLTQKERKQAQKERRKQRQAEEAAREAAVRARQEAEEQARRGEERELQAAIEQSCIEAIREERDRQLDSWRANADAEAELLRRNAVRLSPVRHVGPNGHVSTVYTNRPPSEPVVAPPTLAALGGASSAPPESTIGNARCIVCMDEDKDQLFLPCKHLLCCHSCASHIMRTTKQCPQCRGNVKQVIGGIFF